MAEQNGTTNGVNIHDPSDERKYRTEIPNLIFELNLSPHAGWLYGHLKRVCGANGGKCWKATKTLAKECNMSSGKVSEARAELESHKLIQVHRPKDQSKTVDVTIVDIWRRNRDHFDSKHHVTNERSYNERERSYYETEEVTPEEDVTSTDVDVADATPEVKDVPLAKHITDMLYETSRNRLGIIWSKDEFSYHLGRAGEVERKWNITDEELDELPGAYVDVHGFKGVKADAVEALKNIRTERNMARVQAEKKAEREKRKAQMRGEMQAEPPPWERPNPHAPQKTTRSAEDVARDERRTRTLHALDQEEVGKVLQMTGDEMDAYLDKRADELEVT